MAKTYSEAFCPICGRTAGENLVSRMLQMYSDKKPFGITKDTGYGGFKNFRYIDMKDAPSQYEKLKALFLRAIASWLSKGWLEKKDLSDLIK